MVRDGRGGHNRKLVNEKFFRSWSPSMAYVLGLLFSDGALIDATNSTRTRYFTITSKDYDLLEKVKLAMGSNHSISNKIPHIVVIRGKTYKTEGTHRIRIGNTLMCDDLLNLGLEPHKSLVMRFPYIPDEFLSFFIRGYFDGDGCFNVSRNNNGQDRMRVVFISGSYEFLDVLKNKLQTICLLNGGSLSQGDHAFHLQYGKRDGLKILYFMYQKLGVAPYLARKYNMYQKYLLVSNTA